MPIPSRCVTTLTLLTAACWAAEPGLADHAGAHQAGLLVQIAPVDAQLLAEAAASGRWVALGVATEPAAGDRLRTALAGKGHLGAASIAAQPYGGRIPVVDGSVTVLVADCDALGASAPDQTEVLRALRPDGIARLKQSGAWRVVAKPWPAGFDGWGHHHGGADQNDRNRDTEVTKASGLQWIVGKAFPPAVSHGVRLAGGRTFTVTEDLRKPRKEARTLMARDAFTGIPLWESPSVPAARLCFIVDERRVYMHPASDIGAEVPMIALDAATGKLVNTYDMGFSVASRSYTKAINHSLAPRALVSRGVLVQSVDNRLIALDVESGKKIWEHLAGADEFTHFTAESDGLLVNIQGAGRTNANTYASQFERTGISRVVAYDIKTGEQRWVFKDVPMAGMTVCNLVIGEGCVGIALMQPRATLTDRPDGLLLNLDLKTGVKRFTGPANTHVGYGGHGYFRTSIVNGSQNAIAGPNTKSRLALSDGSPLADLLWHHAFRCHPARSTPNVLLTSLSTSSLIDDRFYWTEATRGTCDLGTFPGYGLIHQDITQCGCFSWLAGSHAFHGRSTPKTPPDIKRLRTGTGTPAPTSAAAATWPAPDAWPMFQRDGSRSMWAKDARISAAPKVAWTTALAPAKPIGLVGKDMLNSIARVGVITGASAAEGVVVVGCCEGQSVIALDATTGTERWRQAVDGRVDTNPTIYRGVVLAGTRAGMVYAFNRDTGALLWSFLAAPTADRLVADGQSESPWMVHGTIQVVDGLAWVMAGREVSTDGGFFWWGLDPATGAVRKTGHAGFDGEWDRIGNYPPKGNTTSLQRAVGARGNGRLGCASTPPVLWDGKFYLSRFGFDPGNGALLESPKWNNTGSEALKPDAPRVARPNNTAGAASSGARVDPARCFGVSAKFIAVSGADMIAVCCKDEPFIGGRNPGSGNKLIRWRISDTPLTKAKPGALAIYVANIWQAKDSFDGWGTRALAICGNTVAVANDRSLKLIDATTGAAIASVDLPAAAVENGLSVAGDTMYVSGIDGSVTAVR